MGLDQLAKGAAGTVVGVTESSESGADMDLSRRLMELGFVVGERVSVMAKAFPSGEPIAVKIGDSTFALRRFEASLIRVELDSE